MGVEAVKPVVESHGSMAVQAKAVGLNIHRRAMRLEGDAYDISRLKQACADKLAQIEQNHQDPSVTYVVNVPAPQEDE